MHVCLHIRMCIMCVPGAHPPRLEEGIGYPGSDVREDGQTPTVWVLGTKPESSARKSILERFTYLFYVYECSVFMRTRREHQIH